MSSIATELQVLYNIGNAPVREYPYPHIFVPEVFPADFYAELRRNLPPPEVMKTLGELKRVQGGDYPERGVLPLTPEDLAKLDEPRRAFFSGNLVIELGAVHFRFHASSRMRGIVISSSCVPPWLPMCSQRGSPATQSLTV